MATRAPMNERFLVAARNDSKVVCSTRQGSRRRETTVDRGGEWEGRMSETKEMTPGDQALLATGHWPASARKMGLGLMLPVSEGAAFGETPHFRDMVEMTKVARDVGFEALWFADHFMFGNAEEGWRGAWDCWTMMAGVAAASEGLQIGSLVACTGYR